MECVAIFEEPLLLFLLSDLDILIGLLCIFRAFALISICMTSLHGRINLLLT